MYLEVNIQEMQIVKSANSFGFFYFQKGNRTLVGNISFNSNKHPLIKQKLLRIDSRSTIKEINSLLPGVYIILLIENNQLFTFRDTFGLKTMYFKRVNKETIHFSSNSYEIAKKSSGSKLSKPIVDQLLSSEFVIDKFSVYDDIFEFKRGKKLI